MHAVIVPPSEAVNELLTLHSSSPIATGTRLDELMRRPELDYDILEPIDPTRPALSRAVVTTAQIMIKYDGYIKRQLAEVARSAKLEERQIPQDIDYMSIKGLRLEAAEKLSAVRPMSIGQASRISGVSPADISVLMIRLGLQ